MKNRKYYENLFADYPSVVTLTQFRGMLGGIGDSTARKLMRENRVKHYYIRMTYLIPKDWVIDYVLSEHYAEYKEQLKVQVYHNLTREVIKIEKQREKSRAGIGR